MIWWLIVLPLLLGFYARRRQAKLDALAEAQTNRSRIQPVYIDSSASSDLGIVVRRTFPQPEQEPVVEAESQEHKPSRPSYTPPE
jgi:hypothetical protein